MRRWFKTAVARFGILLAFVASITNALAHGAWLGNGTADYSADTIALLQSNVNAGTGGFATGDIIELKATFPVIVAGTLSGPGGYITFYPPPGTEVVGTWIVDAASNPINARPGTASTTGEGISRGWGPIGQKTFSVAPNGWAPSSTAVCTANGFTASNCNAGVAYVYGDTGIFYSVRSDTVMFANGQSALTLLNGYQTNPTNTAPWTTVGGIGNERVHNKWDAVQTNAFGTASVGAVVTNGFSATEEFVLANGRGTTPFNAGSPVSGPDSGVAWDRYGTTGPWNRISYPGSCFANDPTIAGTEGPANGAGSVVPQAAGAAVNSVSVCTPTLAGASVSDAAPLPAATTAVRFAVGGIASGETKGAKIRLRVTDPAILSAANFEGHGGDSTQGAAAGNDNPWRYWIGAPATISTPRLFIDKAIISVNGDPYNGTTIPADATVRYRITYANGYANAQTNVQLSDILPTQAVSTSNYTVVSGPNIIPATLPSTGTFNFQIIPSLGMGLGGSVEFDVATSTTLGQTVTNTARINSTQLPALQSDIVSTTVAPATPRLTLVKTITNNNGGTALVSDFTLSATGPTTITGLSGTPAVTNTSVSAGTYLLTETGPTGYIAGNWICTAGALTANSLELTGSQNATCTINNDVDAVAAVIAAIPETYAAINGLTGGVTTTVLGSDTLNGVAVVATDVTIAPGAVLDPLGVASTALSLDPATGLITVAANTPAGIYTVAYAICEILNPTNCANTVETVTIAPAVIAAIPEVYPSVNGLTGGMTTTVLGSDTLNGVAVVATDVTIAPGAVLDPLGVASTALTLDPATGLITVAANTPAGIYTVAYAICEILNPTNCANTVETVTVAPAVIAAIPETYAAINGLTGGVTTTVLGSDTLNGVAVVATDVTIAPGAVLDPLGVASTALTLDPATGLITVAANTPAGIYTVAYAICEILNPTNCANTVETVTIAPAVIAAIPEVYPSVNGLTGGVTTTVLGSDTLNGVAVVATDVTIAPGAVLDPLGVASTALSLDPATGLITVAANTPAGIYTVAYAICEILNPTNCANTVETVTIAPAVIAAIPEVYPSVNGLTGGMTTTVLGSDTLNGVAVVATDVTIAPGAVLDPLGVASTALSLDPATGLITVAANTPAGIYTVAYAICEILNPTNCANTVETVTIAPAVIAAIPEVYPSVNGLTGGMTTTVLGSDTLNGVAVVATDVTIAPGAVLDPLGVASTALSLDPATGLITVAANTPAGIYTVAYAICEILNPTNCANTVETVTIAPAVIAAIPEVYPSVNGLTGGVTTTVLGSDTLNGVAVVATDVTIAPGAVLDPLGVASTALTLDPATGLITVAANTPAGIYTVAYAICEILNPTNCANTVETVTIAPAVIAAIPEVYPSVNGLTGGMTTTVLGSDTLNGVAVVATDVTIAPGAVLDPLGVASTALTLDPATGLITVAANTPAGIYTVAYAICEILNPTNCANTVETVTIAPAVIAAIPETYAAINGLTGGVTTTVLGSDTLNGVAVVATDVTIAPGAVLDPLGVASTALTLDPATGLITVAANTPAGIYTVAYAICEILNPTNCANTVETVTVAPAVIAAIPEVYPSVNGLTGGMTTTVLGSDTLNGVAVVATDVTIAPGAVLDPLGVASTALTLDPATGLITVAANTPAGIYTVAYAICEILNPTNCANTVETVTIAPAVIAAIPEVYPSVNGLTGGVTTTVLGSDTLNGVAVVATDVTIAPGAVLDPLGVASTALTLDPATGLITVAANTPAGIYTVAYAICEILNPTNCANTVETVTIAPAVVSEIIAGNDTATGVDGALGQVNVLNIFANDTLNGLAVDPAAISLTIDPSNPIPAGLIVDLATGAVGVAPGTPAGVYSFNYTICETDNPAVCDPATVSVTVAPPVVLAGVTGTVYLDSNGSGLFDGDPVAGSGYIVDLVDADGNVVATDTTDAAGNYVINAPPGTGYRLVFKQPDGRVIGGIANVALVAGTTITNQNQPIDPSGVVYNSVTRAPVAGAILTIVDAANVPLPDICLVAPSQQNQVTGFDGSYRFDIVPGADPACPVSEIQYRIMVVSPTGYLPGVSTSIQPQAGALDATVCAIDAVPGGSCQVSSSAAQPASGSGTYFMAFTLQTGAPDVVNNHIPLDPLPVPPLTGLSVVKKANVAVSQRGGVVKYSITVINGNAVASAPVNVTDRLPPSFVFVPGSARIGGGATTPVVNSRNLTFADVIVLANSQVTITLSTRVAANAEPGDYVNEARLLNPADGAQLAPPSRATVTIEAEHVFDCGEVIGKVFDDKNRNGYQDKGEPGLPGVRIATVKGLLLTTDKHGRFHVGCADLPDPDIGSNFVMKLDARTLPTGYRLTTENPRDVRLTRGKITKLNFGASIARVVRFDLEEAAFETGEVKLNPKWIGSIGELVAVLGKEPSILRLSYYPRREGDKLAHQRLAAIEKLISKQWKKQSGDYELPIETRVVDAE